MNNDATRFSVGDFIEARIDGVWRDSGLIRRVSRSGDKYWVIGVRGRPFGHGVWLKSGDVREAPEHAQERLTALARKRRIEDVRRAGESVLASRHLGTCSQPGCGFSIHCEEEVGARGEYMDMDGRPVTRFVCIYCADREAGAGPGRDFYRGAWIVAVGNRLDPDDADGGRSEFVVVDPDTGEELDRVAPRELAVSSVDELIRGGGLEG